MATTFPTTPTGTIAVPLEKIHVPANVRELDLEHVDALAGSIALQGQLENARDAKDHRGVTFAAHSQRQTPTS
jgi:hypothetical protein